MAQRKLGVRPETHEAFAQVADETGWSISRAVDNALEALIKHKRLKVKFQGRQPRAPRVRPAVAN